MAKQGFRIIDSEPHFVEPPDLWERNLPEPFRSRTHLVRPENEGYGEGSGVRLVLDGVTAPPQDPNPLVRRRSQRRVPKVPHLLEVTQHPVPERFLEGFDIEGIDVGVLMPTMTMGIVRYDDLDPEHSLALCRVHNDYAAGFVSANPERLKFWAWIPPHDARLAAEEARRAVKELGAAGVAMTGGAVAGHLLCDEFFEPLWEAMDSLGVAFGLHGPPANYMLQDNYNHRYRGHRDMQVLGNAMVPCPCHDAGRRADPGWRSGASSQPQARAHGGQRQLAAVAALAPGDKWEIHAPDVEVKLSMKPSEYFRRQCYAVVESEEEVVKYVLDYMGADNLLFSTDYPHSDSMFPEAVNMFLALEGISDEGKKKILWDNGARLFGIKE